MIRNKILIAVAMGLISASRGLCQIPSQIKAEIQQVAAYGVYIVDIEKGYNVVENGIKTVGQIKNGTFSLHCAFFNSLESINPTVKGYAKVTEIAMLQISIVEAFENTISSFKQAGYLHSDEISYIESVYTTVVNDGLKDLDELARVVTAGNYTMTDADRLRQIDALYSNMSDKYAFTQSFLTKGVNLQADRSSENADLNTLKALYGVN